MNQWIRFGSAFSTKEGSSMLTYLQAQKANPKSTRYTIADIPGLALRISPNGRKTWLVKKDLGGRRIVKTLGEFPAMSIGDARRAFNALIDSAKPEAAPADPTFGEIYARWMEVKKARIKNWEDIDQRMRKYILPLYRTVPFAAITPIELVELLKRRVMPRLETVKRLCGCIRELEVFAVNSGLASSYRLQHLFDIFPAPSTQLVHRPAIPWQELPAFFQEIGPALIHGGDARDLLMTGFYTLLRPGEYAALRWDWISDGVITVPAEAMKMKRAQRVPVSPQLASVLAHRLHVCPLVFPSRNLLNPVSTNALGLFLRRHGFIGRLVPHGIRSIGRSWMEDHGVPFNVAEACLAHSSGTQTVQAYQRSDLLDERRKPMEEWCKFVEGCAEGGGND